MSAVCWAILSVSQDMLHLPPATAAIYYGGQKTAVSSLYNKSSEEPAVCLLVC